MIAPLSASRALTFSMLLSRTFSLASVIPANTSAGAKGSENSLPVGQVDSVLLEKVIVPSDRYVFMYGLEDSRRYIKRASAVLAKKSQLPAPVEIKLTMVCNDTPATESLEEMAAVEGLFFATSPKRIVDMCLDLMEEQVGKDTVRANMIEDSSISINVAFSDLTIPASLFNSPSLPNLKAIICHVPAEVSGVFYRVGILKDASVVEEIDSPLRFYFSGLELAPRS